MIGEEFYKLRREYFDSKRDFENKIDIYLDKLIPLYKKLNEFKDKDVHPDYLLTLKYAIDFNILQINGIEEEIGFLEERISDLDRNALSGLY